jgi:hypothetical protein
MTNAKKCENCGAISPALRKDGSSKIFLKALPDKSRKANQVRVELAVRAGVFW